MKRLAVSALAATFLLSGFGGAFAESASKNDWAIEGTYTKALNILSAEGYTQISSLSRNGQMVEAQAQKGGKPVKVTVDPLKGTVQVQG